MVVGAGAEGELAQLTGELVDSDNLFVGRPKALDVSSETWRESQLTEKTPLLSGP